MQYIAKVKKKLGDLARGGFFHVFMGNTLVKMISFISSIVIVRLVDKDAYAYLTYADNLYGYVIAFAGLGMTSSILKYCAVAKTKEEDKAYFLFALLYGTLFQAVLSVCVAAYVAVCNVPFPQARGLTYLLILYPVLTNILNTVMGYLRAHGENKLYSKLAVVQTMAVFAGSILLVMITGINGIAVARYIAIMLAILFAWKYLISAFKDVKKYKLSRLEMKNFMAMSVSLMIASLFSLIMPMNELTLINELLRDEVVTANYKVAIMIPSQLAFVSQSIVIYYFTIVAKMDNKREIWKLSKKVGLITTGIIFLIAVVGAVLNPLIIRIVYGSRYEDAIILSSIFWFVYAINASVRMIPMNFLPAIGVAKFNAVVAGVSCLVHVICTYVAIDIWGIWGVGIATGVVYLGSAVVYWIYLRRRCME